MLLAMNAYGQVRREVARLWLLCDPRCSGRGCRKSRLPVEKETACPWFLQRPIPFDGTDLLDTGFSGLINQFEGPRNSNG